MAQHVERDDSRAWKGWKDCRAWKGRENSRCIVLRPRARDGTRSCPLASTARDGMRPTQMCDKFNIVCYVLREYSN